MPELRLAVIGCGYWGPNLIRNFVRLSNTEVVAVVDLDEERLGVIAQRYPSVVTTRDYRDLFSMDLNAVVLATPPATHFRIARDCLTHGLSALIEKPMTLKSSDARQLIEIAEKNNLTLMAGHTFEYNPAVRALRKIIISGELGRIFYINGIRANLGLFQNGLNVLWDLAPHDISILLYLLGTEPIKVSARGGACVMDGIHDVVYLHLEFPGNVLAHLHLSWLDPTKVRRITVVGSQKMVVYDDVEPLEKIRIYDKGVNIPPFSYTFEEFKMSYRFGDVVIPYIDSTEPLSVECQHFVDCVRSGARPQSDGSVGLKVVRVTEAAARSLANGGVEESVRVQGKVLQPIEAPSMPRLSYVDG